MYYRGYEIERVLPSFDGKYRISRDGVALQYTERVLDAKGVIDELARGQFLSLEARAEDVNRRIERLTGEPGHVRVYSTTQVAMSLLLEDLEAILTVAEQAKARLKYERGSLGI